MTRNWSRKRHRILTTLLLSGFLMACSDSDREVAKPDVAAQPAASESVFEPTAMNGIGIEFILIPAGEFMMGCGKDDWACEEAEKPQHHVRINQPFYLGKYEVTQGEWEIVMRENPSKFKGDSNPVENVSWNDVQVFIQRLNEKEGTNKYRLPTEAEWEYAARAGTATAYHFGNDVANMGRYAWYDGNSSNHPHPVGQKLGNPWGLYDMHGNVWEWVADGYEDSYSSRNRPANPLSRVLRGGGWDANPWSLRSAFRRGGKPDSRSGFYGFRLAFSPGA
ncbi:MAG: formylglycine-generating enzyme family protein [Zoogloeaceae bacterium]|jgi:formylglycine-generating enzyme required for sulfatase activity|nr:formylglycine-generating enzyme family protein [Zoogloeaceae bacterium]